MTSLERVYKAIEEIRAGRMVILVDDEDRENEGDFCMAAELVTPEAIAFMATHGRGLICLSLTGERCEQLGLPLMVQQEHNTTQFGTAFTVSVDARDGVSTGISAYDRAKTIRDAIAKHAQPDDLVRPGHIFPLQAKEGGVLVRAGQTEGSVDLARLAGVDPSGVICEVMKENGEMARMPDLEVLAEEHGIQIVTIADMIEYRLRTESFVRREAEASIEVEGLGTYHAVAYRSTVDGKNHLALTKGSWTKDDELLVRVHRSNIMGDVFGLHRDGGAPCLHRALEMIEEEGRGVLLYLVQPERGRNLVRSIQTYAERSGARRPAAPGDSDREYGIGAQILADLEVGRLKLLTNNPLKFAALDGYGIEIAGHVPIDGRPGCRAVRPVRSLTSHEFVDGD